MAPTVQTRATLDDLIRVEGKAELIGGRIVPIMPTGHTPNQVTGFIYRQPRWTTPGRTRRGGRAPTASASPSPNCLRAASRSRPTPPTTTARCRPIACGSSRRPDARRRGAQRERLRPGGRAAKAAKRADYFAAGTRVVWDVDPVAELIHVYRADTPEPHATYARGQVAEAEPAVPGWRPAVDSLFDE